MLCNCSVQNKWENKHERLYFSFNSICIFWGAEVLRNRRFASISSFYKEAQSDSVCRTRQNNLPNDPEECVLLAVEIWGLARKHLSEGEYSLLYFRHWGDYATEGRLRRALQLQEKLRNEGKRLRLSYTYSYRQLGTIFKIDHKTVKRHLDKSYENLAKNLEEKGYLESATIGAA